MKNQDQIRRENQIFHYLEIQLAKEEDHEATELGRKSPKTQPAFCSPCNLPPINRNERTRKEKSSLRKDLNGQVLRLFFCLMQNESAARANGAVLLFLLWIPLFPEDRKEIEVASDLTDKQEPFAFSRN